jgi:hypothetical protein
VTRNTVARRRVLWPMRRPAPIALALVTVVVGACAGLPFMGTPPPAGRAVAQPPDSSDPYRDAEAAFESLGIRDYTWQATFACECVLSGPVTITVAGDRATRVTTLRGEIPVGQLKAFPLTIEALLDQVILANDRHEAVGASWARNDGIPSEVHFDPDPNAVDDELSLTVSRFDPAP